ncbi:hypothetical protein G7074_25240 [Pedobacter sp. HDW13]|uniref:hypothetical protein n=1 Tax=unclassified Pedobacter TaxID=2628915 RepID=UPI000F5A7200|nr:MULTISPECIES: hypothetical protein [unclassified Pedobacter]QIL42272.1 hypothetical protein G7074_25240 [Pedobacter sp. HDW13]RQO76486.1 hypothetical protein DBR40_11305 [Pedobacter sp. KBW01]
MKLKIFTLFFFSAVIALSFSCRKAELLQPEPPKIIQLSITGSTTVDLEYLYKDSVVGDTKAGTGGINLKTLLSVKDQNAVLMVRKKGATEILLSKAITAVPFDQNISIFYDGTKIYNNSVTLEIKGFALSGELEFLVDGNVFASGTGKINNVSPILIDKGTTREITVRKKGETAVLLTKTIESAIPRQNINFFFDGIKIADNVKLDPPVNTANMMVKAKFETTFPVQFKNVDVDLVFYTRLKPLSTAAYATAGTKVMPELRVSLLKDGSFSQIELPPLPNADYIYSFDIVEKGTNTVPYTTTSAPFVLATFPFKPNDGRYGEIIFDAGKSKLFVINDSKNVLASTRSTYFSGKITDLSQYFQ